MHKCEEVTDKIVHTPVTPPPQYSEAYLHYIKVHTSTSHMHIYLKEVSVLSTPIMSLKLVCLKTCHAARRMLLN